MARRPQRQCRKINWSGVTSLITAFTAVGALIFTALSLNATRDQVAVTQQGQYTDRYSRAIEQLGRQGPEQLQIRLGGIYALERLAHDSPRDQPTIIEVLITFVRTNVARTPEPVITSPTEAICPDTAPESPRPDVQAALAVLGRRDSTHDNSAVIDLSRTCLRGADLALADLALADLHSADLSGAKLNGANLNSADLTDAKLSHINLDRAILTNAKLLGADLFSASFFGADLRYADLEDAEVRSAQLFDADLRQAYLLGTDFTEADLGAADLSGATLKGAILDHTNLYRANLVGANLVGAVLTRADLGGANLEQASHDESTVVDGVQTDDDTRGRWW
jgi:uncharacterized protein YjbI with pentapeptide repeats